VTNGEQPSEQTLLDRRGVGESGAENRLHVEQNDAIGTDGNIDTNSAVTRSQLVVHRTHRKHGVVAEEERGERGLAHTDATHDANNKKRRAVAKHRQTTLDIHGGEVGVKHSHARRSVCQVVDDDDDDDDNADDDDDDLEMESVVVVVVAVVVVAVVAAAVAGFADLAGDVDDFPGFAEFRCGGGLLAGGL
jgi:hypothetical protein